MKFDYYTKQLLYERLKKKGFVKYLRWYHDEDYLRFRIP